MSSGQGRGDQSKRDGGGGRRRGGDGSGGAKRPKQQQGRARPEAPPAPSLDLPLPEGGVHIDGSMLEGGGQILRNASSLAAILRRPIKVDLIRAGRDRPGAPLGRCTRIHAAAAAAVLLLLCSVQIAGCNQR